MQTKLLDSIFAGVRETSVKRVSIRLVVRGVPPDFIPSTGEFDRDEFLDWMTTFFVGLQLTEIAGRFANESCHA